MIPVSKPYIGEAEKQAVMEVLDSGMLAQGPRTAKFEDRFARSMPSPRHRARPRCISHCWPMTLAKATK